MADVVSDLIKNSDLCIHIGLSRSRHGIRLDVKTSPVVETFMRSLGNGEKQPISAWGRDWVPDNEDTQLVVWRADSSKIAKLTTSSGIEYGLNYVARALDISADLGTTKGVANLSFLRLVGVGEGNGVSFHIKNTVSSLSNMRDLKNLLGSAAKNLYADYIRPVNLNVYVAEVQTLSEEIRG